MTLSHAQKFEDRHLDFAFGVPAAGARVDVGGGHPAADNVSFHSYPKGWHVLVVEVVNPGHAESRPWPHRVLLRRLPRHGRGLLTTAPVQ